MGGNTHISPTTGRGGAQITGHVRHLRLGVSLHVLHGLQQRQAESQVQALDDVVRVVAIVEGDRAGVVLCAIGWLFLLCLGQLGHVRGDSLLLGRLQLSAGAVVVRADGSGAGDGGALHSADNRTSIDRGVGQLGGGFVGDGRVDADKIVRSAAAVDGLSGGHARESVE